MAIKTITDDPTIADMVQFQLLTPGSDNCFTADPYQIDSVKIYFIERDTVNGSNNSASDSTVDSSLSESLIIAQQRACISPTDDNLGALASIQQQILLTSKVEEVRFKQATVVASFGTDQYPAWLSTDQSNSILEHITVDIYNSTIYGNFFLTWTPNGMREGDYYICWTWTPLMAGDKISNYSKFYLSGDTAMTTSIPTHFTNPEKYSTLLENYLPELFKVHISNNDLTPEVMQEFNNSVADLFTLLENLANQIVDLQDANSINESFLPLLGNMFGLKLRSNDPTLWRRQIKRSINVAKAKGTLGGLTEALAQAGITLNAFTRLWQVVSKYTYQEAFVATVGQTVFPLKKYGIEPQLTANHEMYYRPVNGSWTSVSNTYGTIVDNMDGTSSLHWVGTPGTLAAGAGIRVIYQIAIVPTLDEQTNETYIRALPLADQRDERSQIYPLKNWNVKVIAEDDAAFNTIIPTKVPFANPVIFGKIRTEFAYSENVYDMDEFNGSRRDSIVPCDIDRDFLDLCSASQGSKYNVDLEIENISDNRIIEAQEILNEFTPFHAVLHGLNIYGGLDEFIQPPIEDIEIIIQHNSIEELKFDLGAKMQLLSNMTTITHDAVGLAKNASISLNCPNTDLKKIETDSAIVEIMSPSANSGLYKVENIKEHSAFILGAKEPINKSAFTFRIIRELVSGNANISEESNYILKDQNVDFSLFNISKGCIVQLGNSSKSITVLGLFEKGLLLDNSDFLIKPTLKIIYKLKNRDGVAIKSSSTGSITVERVGKIKFSRQFLHLGQTAHSIEKINNLIGSYVELGQKQYYIKKIEQNYLIIDGYNGGNINGKNINIFQILVKDSVGYLNLSGLCLETEENHEESEEFKNNHVVLIGSNYFSISKVDGKKLWLTGPSQGWPTNGIKVNYTILKHNKSKLSAKNIEHQTKGDTEIIKLSSPQFVMQGNLSKMLNKSIKDQASDEIAVEESIEIIVERKKE